MACFLLLCHRTNVFEFWWCPVDLFFFYGLCFHCPMEEPFAWHEVIDSFPVFSKSSVVLHITFRLMVHSLRFYIRREAENKFSFWHVGVLFFLVPFVEDYPFFTELPLCVFSKTNRPHLRRFISDLSLPFHWSVCLYSYQSFVPNIDNSYLLSFFLD